MVDTKNITYDRVLSLDKTSATGDKFTWEPDTRYIYYLHIPNLIKDEIEKRRKKIEAEQAEIERLQKEMAE